jgi:hypothetical protein
MTIVRKGWKHQDITILHVARGSMKIAANVYKDLAVHRCLDTGGWVITHVPSAIGIHSNHRVWASELAAMCIVESMYVVHADWDALIGGSETHKKTFARLVDMSANTNMLLCTYPRCQCFLNLHAYHDKPDCPKRYHKKPLD